MNYKFQLSVLTGAVMIAVLATLIAPMYTGAVGPSANPPDNSGLVPTFSGLNVDGDSTLSGDLSLGGQLSDPDSAVEVNDSLNVTNDLSASGNLSVTGTSTLSGINDFRGEIKNNRTCHLWDLNCFSDIFINDNLRLGDSTGWNLSFEGVNFGVATNGQLIIDGDVEVRGKLKADQVGRIYSVSATRSVTNNTSNSQSVTCNSGDTLLSCFGGFDPDTLNTTLAAVIGQEPYSSGAYQGCKVSVWNKTGASQTMYAHAICIAQDENWG